MRYFYSILKLTCIISLFLHPGCNDDHSSIDIPDETAPEGEGFFSINLTTDLELLSKAPSDDNINVWENRVNEIWILLYNESDKLEYKFVLNIKNYKENDLFTLINFYDLEQEEDKKMIYPGSETKLRFTTIAQSIKRQQYRMAVLANPPKTIFDQLDFTKDSEISNLTNAIGSAQESVNPLSFGGYYDENNAGKSLFFMSNANGLITIPTSKLQPTKEKAYANPVKANLERILSKVVVREKEEGVTINPTDVILDRNYPVQWYLDVTNKKTFLIRQYALFKDGVEMENEQNSLTVSDDKIYAKDPNFKLSENNTTEFNKIDFHGSPDYSAWLSKFDTPSNTSKYQYVIENTLDLESQAAKNWKDYTTQIVLKVHLIYKNLLWDKDDPYNENDPNRNYYSCPIEKDDLTIQWVVFTHEQVLHWLDRGFPTDDDNIPVDVMTKLEEKIKEIKKDKEDNKPGAFDFTSTGDPGINESAYHTYKNVTYHPLGLNLYIIPIRHFNASQGVSEPQKNTYGYYGVVRNNVYEVTINSISGPGTGVYDWENRFISADVSITPWYKRIQIIDLEYPGITN